MQGVFLQVDNQYWESDPAFRMVFELKKYLAEYWVLCNEP